MADSAQEEQYENPPEEVTESSDEEVEHSEQESNSELSEEADSISEDSTDELGEDVSIEDLNIDLDSLTLNAPHILGKPKKAPSLTTSKDKRPVGRPQKEDEGIFAWCEQFSYTPGVEYLKLNRLYPKTWEGINIVGFIEEIYEPIDEHWLADRWGGGTYQLDAYQRDSSGRSRKTQVKGIEISGIPKSYMGTDGYPHDLPSSRNMQDSSRRSSDVLRRRMGLGRYRSDHEDYEEEAPVQRARPSSVDKPLTDASTLYKVIQESKKSENEALGVLREAQKDVHVQMQQTASQQAEMYKNLIDQQKREMDRVREESRAAAENSSAPFKEMLQFLATQGSNSGSRESLEALRQTHESAVASLSKEHNRHLDDVRRNAESRQTQLMDELNRVRTDYANNIERIRIDFLEKERSAKDEAFRNYQTQIDVMRNQSSDLRERHRDEIANVSREKNEIINQLRQDLQELRTTINTKDHEYRTSILEERQRIKDEYEDRYTTKLEAIKEAHESKIQTITQTAETKITAAEKESKQIVESAKRELKSQYEGQTARLEAEIESLKKEHQVREQLSIERSRLESENAQKERDNQRLIMESTAQSQQMLAEMTRKQLEQKVKDLTKDLDFAKQHEQALLSQQAAPESNDPFEQLEKLEAIKTKLKKHGFIDSSEEKESEETEKEEKPKSFFDKVLHYGPQIVGPILQRVDAATAVAQQAVAQQQVQENLKSRDQMIAQQRQIEMEKQQAQQRAVELQQHREMLLQRRVERENALRTERVEVAQNLERERQAPAQSPVQEPIQVETQEDISTVEVSKYEPGNIIESGETMTENEGYYKLGEYLSGAISEKKDSSAMVKELKMAKFMGMFSQETLNGILAEDFDTLVEKLSSSFSNLRSPKSRIILKSVMEGMKK